MTSKAEISVKSTNNSQSEDKYMLILNKIGDIVQVLEKQSILLREQNATISRFHNKLSVLEAAIGGLRNDNAMLKNEIRVTAARMVARPDSATVERELNVAMPNAGGHHPKAVNVEVLKKKTY